MKKYLRGIVLVGIISVLSIIIEHFISDYIKLESLTIGIIISIIYSHFRKLKKEEAPGVKFSSKKLLEWGIILLGFKLNFLLIANLGYKIVILIICFVPTVIFIAGILGKIFGLNSKLSTLIGVGSSICGASAIVAMSSVIDSSEDDTVLAVSIISFLGAIGVILYSSISIFLNVSDMVYGAWSGISLQGVAHAIAAAFARGSDSGEIGTIVKMSRVLMIAPMSIFLSSKFKNAETDKHKILSIPAYVILFIFAGIIGTTGIIPNFLLKILVKISNLFILMAMVAMGLKVNLRDIGSKGARAIFHGLTLFSIVSVMGLFFVYNILG